MDLSSRSKPSGQEDTLSNTDKTTEGDHQEADIMASTAQVRMNSRDLQILLQEIRNGNDVLSKSN